MLFSLTFKHSKLYNIINTQFLFEFGVGQVAVGPARTRYHRWYEPPSRPMPPFMIPHFGRSSGTRHASSSSPQRVASAPQARYRWRSVHPTRCGYPERALQIGAAVVYRYLQHP